jgi:hypothetical protein
MEAILNRLLCVCLGIALLASSAAAGTPGLNLSWNKCVTDAASGDKSYLCDGNAGVVFQLTGTFRPDMSMAVFTGTESILNIDFGGPVPDYWRFDPSGCMAGSFMIGAPLSASPCAANPFDPSFTGSGYVASLVSPTRLQVSISSETGAPVPPSLTAGLLYPAFTLAIDPDLGIHTGCAGCSQAACLSLVSVLYHGPNTSYPAFTITTPDVRASISWQGGAVSGTPCPAATPTRNGTWGSVKALYR